MPAKQKPFQRLYLISDSSGNLIEHYFNAILTQFPRNSFRVYSRPFVDTEECVFQVLAKIKSGIICYAIIDNGVQTILVNEAQRRGLPAWDITTPTVDFLEKASSVHPVNAIHALHPLDDAYLARMAAIEFAMQHDDNRRIDELQEADIVLVGISRVSKSPNALYLGHRGFKVANISIVPSEGLPKPLSRHRRKNVVALTIQPKRLAEIRHRRFARWRLDEFDYTDIREVIHEVRDAEEIYNRKKWPVINTTDLAVEETSSMILDALKLRDRGTI